MVVHKPILLIYNLLKKITVAVFILLTLLGKEILRAQPQPSGTAAEWQVCAPSAHQLEDHGQEQGKAPLWDSEGSLQ